MKVSIIVVAHPDKTYTLSLAGLGDGAMPTTIGLPWDPLAAKLRGLFHFSQETLLAMKAESDNSGSAESGWFEASMEDLRAFGFRGLPNT
ncbi:MAG TPA: hypothetical protein VKB58_10730 [Terriglobales bacterium]|jgi:hypothetical protein|nr:hypothetical protein [Terriglobales bacterium]